MLTVKATDEDSGPNGEIVYYLDEKRINNEDWKSFDLDSKTGELTLKTKLNMNHQSVYTIDLIASDMGRPTQLNSRFTLTFIIVDDTNNTAKFNRMEICLSGAFQCEKNYQTLVVKLKEEQEPELNSVYLNLAKISDITKSDQDICYFLLGKDKNNFKLNKTSGHLVPKQKLDRESRDKYEVIIKSTEYCFCPEDFNTTQSQVNNPNCAFMNSSNGEFDSIDISLLRVKILVEDLNDNIPKFNKNFYQIGITSDIGFGETILESFAIDSDILSVLNYTILHSSYISNIDKKQFNQLPFSLEFFQTQFAKNDTKVFREAKFQIKTQQYFKEQNYLNEINKNIYFQFNLTVFDQNNLNDTSIVQIILINKQQRVKLVFSQSIDKVVKFQDEFQEYISNLTGFIAYVDKISVHRGEDYDEEESLQSLTNKNGLTDMLLHFVEPSSDLFKLDSIKQSEFVTRKNVTIKNNPQHMIVDAETILNILDRSKDENLLRKYKLSLAEKYDDQGSSTFYKYGSAALEDNFGSFFLLSPATTNTSNFFPKLFFSFFLIVLLFCSTSMLIVCFCMRHKYKRKLKAERAMVKAFGLEQRSMSYNDGMSGYINHGFDSNSLLPIPGTNLYAYEGSNPIWLKKYDKIDPKTNSSSNSSSSSTTSEIHDTFTGNRYNFKESNLTNQNLNKSQDISSFYLKQIDSTPGTSRCSPATSSNNTDKSKNQTLTSDILSVQELSPNYELKDQNLSSFKTETLLTFASSTPPPPLPPLPATMASATQVPLPAKSGNEVISFKEQIKMLSNQKMRFNSNANSKDQMQSVTFSNSSHNYTKIFDNYQQQIHQQPQTQDKYPILNGHTPKDMCDLFAVESTVI